MKDGKEVQITVDFMDPEERFFRNAMASGKFISVECLGVSKMVQVVGISKLADGTLSVDFRLTTLIHEVE